MSPGAVSTEIAAAGGLLEGQNKEQIKEVFANMPLLKSEDISEVVMFLLTTDYNVNISEVTVKPVGEKN